MGYVAETVRRFYHPAAIDEMLSIFVPMINATSLNVSSSNPGANPESDRNGRIDRAYSLRNIIC